MKAVFQKFLIIACALYLSGAHWAILQVTAWTGMLVARTQTSSVAEAVVTTFDGEHPCAMCSAIAVGQKEEKQQQQKESPALKAMQEIKLVVTEVVALPQPNMSGETVWADFLGMDRWRTDAPPVPPPLA